jgi:hypothetical protein
MATPNPVTLLTPAQYADVRAAIQVDLTADDLPDSIIGQDQFAGAAERDVLRIAQQAPSNVPMPPGRGTPEFQMLVTASVQFCAARLMHSIPSMRMEMFADSRFMQQPMDWDKRAMQLVQRGMGSIAGSLNLSLADLLFPSAMALANGGRGDTHPLGWNWVGGPVFMGPY